MHIRMTSDKSLTALRFNKPIKPVDTSSNNLSFVGRLKIEGQSGIDDGGYDKSLLAIDTLKVDNRSRITLTKDVRGILPFKPGDRIAIYQDRTNCDIVLKVQRGSVLIDALRVTKEGVHTHNKKTEDVSIQRDFRNSLDKISELTAPRYYSNDPLKRYFPNIVLIDDDSDILLTFQAYLSAEGFNVQIFSKSNEALKYLMSHSHEYRVVITDIRMPDVNGLEIYQKIKSVNENIRVIFVSALDAADELLSIFSDVKEDDIIRKPIERDQFVERVKAAIFGCLSSFSLLNLGSIIETFSFMTTAPTVI
jgi:CheY-like chemotaxis protein